MLIVVSLLILPILEVWAAIVVAGWIGVLPTVLALIGLSVAGVVLVRSEGLAVWRRANEELAAGRPPTESLLDGLMVVVGGLLLIVPGFLTAIPGLALLFPPTRSLLRPVVARWIDRRAARSAAFMTASFGNAGRGTGSFGAFSFGGGRGPIVDADSRDSSVRASYAEVIDIDVDAPRQIDPPR